MNNIILCPHYKIPLILDYIEEKCKWKCIDCGFSGNRATKEEIRKYKEWFIKSVKKIANTVKLNE